MGDRNIEKFRQVAKGNWAKMLEVGGRKAIRTKSRRVLGTLDCIDSVLESERAEAMIDMVCFSEITVNKARFLTGTMFSDVGVLVIESLSDRSWFRIRLITEINELVRRD